MTASLTSIPSGQATVESLVASATSKHQRGLLDEAAVEYEQAIDLDPGRAGTHHLLGILRCQQGQMEAGLRHFRAALQADPRSAELHACLGRALRDAGSPDDALESLGRAVTLKPDHSLAHFDRGTILSRLGRTEEAIASYSAAISAQPHFVQALYNRATALARMRRFDDALADLDLALRIDTQFVPGWANRGNVLLEKGRYNEALESYKRALLLRADHAVALHGAGSACMLMRRYPEALAYLRQLAAVTTSDEDFPAWRGLAMQATLHCCDWQDYDSQVEAAVHAVRASKPNLTPWEFVAICQSPADQLLCSRAWSARYAVHQAPAQPRRQAGAHRRLKVAYLSADFHEHATAYLISGLIERHDRDRFEVYGVSLAASAVDPARIRLERAFEHTLDISGLDDQRAADQLRTLEIDIAIDLNGHTTGGRPGILARRAAPLQVSYLGFPATSGAPYIDYLIADPITAPMRESENFSESIVHLPHCYQVNDDRRGAPGTPPSRASAGLPADAFVYACFNASYKIAPAVFATWLDVLAAVPDSVLWLLETNPVAPKELRAAAARRGIDPARLVFAPWASHREHMARLALADLFLDTLPCNAHTTASDALWVGLPVLTATGPTFAGRVCASLLRAVDLPELVAGSLEQYRDLAQRLGRERAELGALRDRLRSSVRASPLFNTDSTRRALESAYATMWARHDAGLPPAHFAVADQD